MRIAVRVTTRVDMELETVVVVDIPKEDGDDLTKIHELADEEAKDLKPSAWIETEHSKKEFCLGETEINLITHIP